jgi:hypothetical protein
LVCVFRAGLFFGLRNPFAVIAGKGKKIITHDPTNARTMFLDPWGKRKGLGFLGWEGKNERA